MCLLSGRNNFNHPTLKEATSQHPQLSTKTKKTISRLKRTGTKTEHKITTRWDAKTAAETKHYHNDSQNSHKTAFLHSHFDVLCVSFPAVWDTRKKMESKTHTSKKVLVFHNCLNGCQVMQSGWLWAVTTSTTSPQIRTKHLILAARGTFYSDAAEDFTARLPVWLADQGTNKNQINPNWFLCYIYCKLPSIWMASWWQFG